MRLRSVVFGLAFGFAAWQGVGASPAVTKDVVAKDVGSSLVSSVPVGAATSEYLSARFAAEHHDYAKAAALFAASLDRDPNNPQLLTSAFFYAVAAGRVDAATGYAQRLSSVGGSQRLAGLALAAVAMKHGDYAAVRAMIAKSGREGLATYTVNLIDAWAAAGAGDRAGAAAILKGLESQRGIEAVVAFNQALLAEYFSDAQAAEALYRPLVTQTDASPRVVDAYGRFLERQGKTHEAEALYNAALNDSASRPVATAGKARLALGTKPDAFLRKPEDAAAEALLGVATSIGDESGADVSIVFLQLAKYLRPDFELADLMIADRYELVGNLDAAIAIYDAVQPSSPYYRVASLQKVADKMMSKRDDDAFKDMEALVAQYPDDVTVCVTYGDTLRQLKKYDAAVQAYSKALKMLGAPQKKNWTLLFARANAAQSAGDWKAAEDDLKLAMQLNPEEPQILNFLGYTWIDQNENLRQGMAMLEKANRLAPNDGYITDSVGWAYYRLGRYREATEMLERAVLLVPQDPTINDHLGDVYWKTGRKLEAGFQWSHALAFGPSAEDKVKIAKKLHDLPSGE